MTAHSNSAQDIAGAKSAPDTAKPAKPAPNTPPIAPTVSSSGRVPPQDLNAEKSLLGAILLSDAVFPDILEKVQAEDFYESKHSIIFRAMTNLYNSHRPIDLLTLTSALKAEKSLSSVGGAGYLAELTNFVPTAAHAAAYADLIAETAVRRRLIQAGSQITATAFETNRDLRDLLDSAEKTLFSVTGQTAKTDFLSLDTLLVDALERIENLHSNRSALRGLKTGFTDLDRKTAGFQPGDLIVIGARPAMGKTTLAQNLATNIASINRRGVLFFSMEMARDEIVDRIISDLSGIDNWKIRTGNVSDADFSQISDAVDAMADLPLYIDDTSSMTVLELRNKARRAKHDHDIGVVIVDYLQLIAGSDRYAGNRVQEVTEISRGLKILARELEIPVVALAQLSRNVTGREDPRPVLSDLRESGSIEQDADLVMFIHRPDYYRQNDDDYEETHITELLIAKHRHGPIGKVELYFHPELLRFMSLEKQKE